MQRIVAEQWRQNYKRAAKDKFENVRRKVKMRRIKKQGSAWKFLAKICRIRKKN